MTDTTTVATGDQQLGKVAAALGVAAAATMLVLAALDHDGGAWFLQLVFGLAAVVTGWRAGGTDTRNTPAFAGLALGALMTAIFLAFMIFES